MAAMGEPSVSPQLEADQGDVKSRTAESFVHVQITSGDDGLSKHDAGLAGKKNRRRTSPRDHAVLEAAYLRNSKPDKAERVDIVSRVELGEKEVQIWFQNRRQNDRRRSKPLQPHELLAHLRNGAPSPVPQPSGSADHVPLQAEFTTKADTSHAHPKSFDISGDIPPRPTSRASGIHNLLNYPSSAETTASEVVPQTQTQETSEKLTPPSSFDEPAAQPKANSPNAEEIINNAEEIIPDSQPSSQTSSQHGSGKKRALDEMLGTKDRLAVVEGSAFSPSIGKEPLKRSPSMHLAITDDGAVKVRTNNDPTPSPPKARAPPPKMFKTGNGLQRSKSAVGPTEIFEDAGEQRPKKTFDSRFGRSRDSRVWEFYCDGGSGDALSKQAEAETTGSAVGAISLMRSNSSKNRSHALSPAVSKVNAQPVSATAKSKKARFSRARSSMAILQNVNEKIDSDVAGMPPKGKKPGHRRTGSSDSDKENWLPGTRMSEHGLRRTQPSTNTRDILRDNEGMIFPDVSTTREKVSPRKERAEGEELDCVQGLLSLSQGNWR